MTAGDKPTYEELERRIHELEASARQRDKGVVDGLIESIPAGVVVHGCDGAVIQSNVKAQTMLGLTHAEMLGKELIDPVWTFLREDGSPLPVEEYPVSRVIATKKPVYNIVLGVQRSSTTEPLWVSDTVIPKFDEDGHVTEIITTFMDITALKTSAERYQNLFEYTMQEVHLWKLVRDAHGAIKTWRLVEINPVALKAWGNTRSEIINKTANEIFSYEATEQFMPIVKKIFSEGTPHTWEAYFPPTGEFLHMTSVPFGEYFMSTGMDIGDRKRVEDALKEGEEKFRSIFENSALGIFRSTPKGRYELVNDAFARILGFASPEQLLEEVTDISTLYKHPEDRTQIIKDFAEKGSVEDYEILANHHAKKIVWISVNARQRQYADGTVYYEGTIQDITERKQAEQDLREALKEKDILMKELNHRVKNNLLMVSSLISLKDAETDSDLSDIQHQIEAISLIHENLYRSNSVGEINCREYFGGLLASIFSSFTKRSVRIDTHIDDVYVPTKDGVSLGLIVNEIAINAIKHGFTDSDDAVFSITLGKDTKQNWHELVLSNTGNPFPEDIAVGSTDTLGLRLINALVAQLGGTIELQRRPVPVFTITFP